MTKLSLGIFLILFSLISSKTKTTDNLPTAISQASPGDTIELKTGTYTSVSYGLKSGTEGKPITINPTNAFSMFMVFNMLTLNDLSN